MRSAIAVIFLVFCFVKFTNAQTDEAVPVSDKAIYKGDTINQYTLPVVDIYDVIPKTASGDLKAYYKLRRDILRAYPYAKLASTELKFINDSVAKIKDKKDQKKFIKAEEKRLKAEFEKPLKNLTMTQGRILIKLIDRETGNTSYELVKELRGGFNAFIWQGIARLFGSNLKAQYDPEGEDKLMEQIVQSIERGELKLPQAQNTKASK